MIIKPTTPKIYTSQDKSCVLNLDARDVRGSKIYDRSGKGNHGAITGAVIKPMNYGLPVLDFDGIDDEVNCGSNASLKPEETFTISYLFNPKEWSDGVLEKGILGFTTQGFYLNFWIDNLYFQFWNGVSWQGINFILPSLDKWYHIVGTYDKNAGSDNLKIYSNSVLQNQVTRTGSVLYNDSDFLIGARVIFLNNSINDIRIYNRVLFASEISQYFNNLRNIYGI